MSFRGYFSMPSKNVWVTPV